MANGRYGAARAAPGAKAEWPGKGGEPTFAEALVNGMVAPIPDVRDNIISGPQRVCVLHWPAFDVR